MSTADRNHEPAGTPLVAHDPLRAICHERLEDSERRRPPTVGDLQLQLTTALATVCERGQQIAELQRAVQAAEAELATARRALARAEGAEQSLAQRLTEVNRKVDELQAITKP